MHWTRPSPLFAFTLAFVACGTEKQTSSSGDADGVSGTEETTQSEDSETPDDSGVSDGEAADTLPAAYADFADHVLVYLDGDEVVIESNGLPDHTSPYWSPTHELYVEPTVADHLVPGYIDDFNGSYTLRVPLEPTKASTTQATTLGPIGIARSGSMIYNDQEGPGRELDEAAGGLDYTGAHTGPGSYHYHLEPTAWSYDDDALIGIIADGFFLYGRRCASTGDHPTDLDASGGHTATTQHTSDSHYHYHIKNELYVDRYYILFPGDYQGTPSTVQ